MKEYPGNWGEIIIITIIFSPFQKELEFLAIYGNSLHIRPTTEFPTTIEVQVKNLPANAGDARDADSILASRRYPENEMATHSSILA